MVFKDYYISFCGRPDTYAWGVDYDPDENGTFRKNVNSQLLELPNLDFSRLPTPTIDVRDAKIPKPAKPTAAPQGSTYVDAVSVTLSSVNEGSKIYYTTNGSAPSASSTLYTGPVAISSTCVLKAVAIRDGSPASDIMTENYTITPGRQQLWYYEEHNLSRADGGTVVKEQGDGNVNSQSGKNTDWEIEVTLTPKGNNALDSFTYRVKEKGGDNTILKLTQDVIIPLNKNDIQIVYPYNNYYTTGTITGIQHNYVVIRPEKTNDKPIGGPIYDLWVKIDGPGYDEGNIAVRVWLGFHYTYQP